MQDDRQELNTCSKCGKPTLDGEFVTLTFDSDAEVHINCEEPRGAQMRGGNQYARAAASGYSMIELVFVISVITVIAGFAALVMPSAAIARIGAEGMVTSDLLKIDKAELEYAMQFGHYSPVIDSLGGICDPSVFQVGVTGQRMGSPAQITPNGMCMVDQSLVGAVSTGTPRNQYIYTYTVTPSPVDGVTPVAFAVVAVPVNPSWRTMSSTDGFTVQAK